MRVVCGIGFALYTVAMLEKVCDFDIQFDRLIRDKHYAHDVQTIKMDGWMDEFIWEAVPREFYSHDKDGKNLGRDEVVQKCQDQRLRVVFTNIKKQRRQHFSSTPSLASTPVKRPILSDSYDQIYCTTKSNFIICTLRHFLFGLY